MLFGQGALTLTLTLTLTLALTLGQGTTCYMAPERLNGSNYSYGADIWQASLAQSGVRRSGIPKGLLVITP